MIGNEIKILLNNKQFEKTFQLANDIENEEDGIKFYTQGFIPNYAFAINT